MNPPDRANQSGEVRLDSLRLHVVTAAEPAAKGVLLYPTITGIDDNMRRFADELAALGMTAAVWDPYDGEETSPDIKEMLGRSKKCEDRTMVADLQRIAGYMQGELGVSAIGAIGWCFGGRVALLHAGSDQRIAVVAAYNPTIYSPTPVEIAGVGTISRAALPGQTMNEFELAKSIRGPVQVSRPERDFTQPSEYARLFGALCERPDPTVYEFHPGAGHGFSYTPGDANEMAHRLAWANTRTLFASLGAVAPVDRTAS